MNKKNIALTISVIIIITLFVYCFYPVITYKEDTENSPGRIFLKDRNGKIITDKSKPGGYKEKDIFYDKNLKIIESIIKIEDKNFFKHLGISIPSKIRAIKDNIYGKKISGGSTITEQYIKNRYFKNKSRTYLQKIREAILAISFEIIYSKEEILNNYLNNIYLGNGIYGLKGASNIYFEKKQLKNLTDEEITILVSLINNPSIKSLKDKDFLEYFEKVKKKLNYKFEKKIFVLNKKKNIDLFPFVTNNNIKTIDYDLQSFSKKVLNKTINSLKSKNVTNGAIFAINPSNGEILIYQGSKDFYSKEIDGQVDIIRSKRQPGSTMKPFLYLLALMKGANSDDFLIDLETKYNTGIKNKTFLAQNYSLKEYGLIRLKKALGNSLNNASVRLAKEIGLQEVYDFYKKSGFELEYPPNHYGYSLVLGNPDITLYNLVNSYKNLIPKGEDINKFLLYNILKNPDNRDISFGVNSILNTSIFQAVKTGTSSDFRDNLIISYHPNFIIGIWVGNNDNSSMIGVTGITGAGYIWHQIIEKAIKLGYIKNTEVKIPNGIIKKDYCLDVKCYRKEIIYSKTNKSYDSRIADSLYFKKDIFENLLNEEIIRLEKKGFIIN
ncbi:hypothetical protein CSA08_02235 [Candidatus Gracilibacteria bacterium]|nr:MAG: hypothetical protein CSA08_02235 [Candidatus Gracilibacteria bacterium]